MTEPKSEHVKQSGGVATGSAPGGADDSLCDPFDDDLIARVMQEWQARAGALHRGWDDAFAALEAQCAAGERRAALARRVVLDGAPGVASFTAVVEVLDGAAAWTSEQAATAGFVDEFQDGAVSGFAALHRLQNHALWLQLRCAETVVRAWTGRTPTLSRKTRTGRVIRDDQDALVNDAVATELALAAGITHGRAAALIDAATALLIDGRLPLTAQVLQQGRLDRARLRLIVSRTQDLSLEATHAVEARVYANPKALNGGIVRFENALTAAILSVDADAEAKRRARHRKGRRVSIQTGEDGAAWFTATGPGEAITAAYNGLDAAARYLRAHGDPRTLDQLRHDLFVTGCTSGYLPVPADLLPVPPGCAPTDPTTPSPTRPQGPPPQGPQARGPQGQAAQGPAAQSQAPTDNESAQSAQSADDEDSPSAWFTSTWPDVQVTVNVTVSAETLMGLVNDPGTLQGYGPIPADAIRDLVKNGVFRCVVVDGEHGTVLGVGKNTFSPGYVASDRLKLLAEHAFPTCDVPWCTKAAQRCDLDHQTPHANGGVTCECNIRPLCRGCHRLKTAGLLVPEQRGNDEEPPGTTTWTTRTGRAYTAFPHVPLPHTSPPASAAPADNPFGDAGPTTIEEDPPPF